jgi:predicted RNA-binding Zn-ribbon protein involved in translation (DUF1610 family)
MSVSRWPRRCSWPLWRALAGATVARTCEECGYTGRIPRSAARRRIKTISLFGTPPTARARAELGRQVASISASNNVYETYQHCPECGAEHYTQHAVRDDPPA